MIVNSNSEPNALVGIKDVGTAIDIDGIIITVPCDRVVFVSE